MHDFYFRDDRPAVDAKFEAQRIVFAPIAFQAARTMRETGILAYLLTCRSEGTTIPEVARHCKISEYGAAVLMEFGLGLGLVKIKSPEQTDRFVVGKTGFFFQEDEMTRVNTDFVHDVCYRGAFHLRESIEGGHPAGLKVFGEWKTIYEGLSQLPEPVQESWFAFDHFYSDIAFVEAMPIVYARKPVRLLDIGGNTARWAIASCRFDPDVRITIVDLPGQTAVAERNVAKEGFSQRIDTAALDILSTEAELPRGADAVWMSQFLDCFSLPEVTQILTRVRTAVDENCDVYVLEPLWDKQRFEAASYSLQATSLYFTVMANGNSKMYRFEELTGAVERAGFRLREAHHNLGANAYSLLRFRKVPDG